MKGFLLPFLLAGPFSPCKTQNPFLSFSFYRGDWCFSHVFFWFFFTHSQVSSTNFLPCSSLSIIVEINSQLHFLCFQFLPFRSLLPSQSNLWFLSLLPYIPLPTCTLILMRCCSLYPQFNHCSLLFYLKKHPPFFFLPSHFLHCLFYLANSLPDLFISHSHLSLFMGLPHPLLCN